MANEIKIAGQYYGSLEGYAFVFDWCEHEEPMDDCIPVFVPALAKALKAGAKFLFAYSTSTRYAFCISVNHAQRIGRIEDNNLRIHVNHWEQYTRQSYEAEKENRMGRMEALK